MTSTAETEREASRWLAQRESGRWTAREEAQLRAWLQESTAHRIAFLRLQEAWSEAARLRALGAGIPSGHVPERGNWHEYGAAPAGDGVMPPFPPDLRGIHMTYHRPDDGRGGWRRGIAAMLVLAAVGVAGVLGWQAGGRHHALFASSLGQVESVALADGTRVTLSSDSRIEVTMKRRRRSVRLLQGEAIFTVAHDPARPFVVALDATRITAVGTRFSVRRAGPDARVVVTEGRVRFERDADGNGIAPPVTLLSAGHVAFADGAGVRIESMTPAEAERLLEWRSGYLGFDDTSLANAAAEFNRFNLRKLELADARVADLRIGGNFRWDNLEGFIHLLERGFPVRAERLPDRIVLHSL